MWDVTCPDTYAPSHLALAGVEAGVEAGSEAGVEAGSEAGSEALKLSTSGQNIKSCTRVPFLCLWPSRHQELLSLRLQPFYTDLGKWIADQLKESRPYSFLFHRVAVEVQRDNAGAILGTLS